MPQCLAVIDRAAVQEGGPQAWGGVDWKDSTGTDRRQDKAGGGTACVSTGTVVVAGLDVPFAIRCLMPGRANWCHRRPQLRDAWRRCFHTALLNTYDCRLTL